jgi:hypothetical protein
MPQGVSSDSEIIIKVDAPSHNLHCEDAHPLRPRPLLRLLGVVLPNDLDEQRKEYFGFGLELKGELFEEEEDDTRAAQCEREQRPVGERLEE